MVFGRTGKEGCSSFVRDEKLHGVDGPLLHEGRSPSRGDKKGNNVYYEKAGTRRMKRKRQCTAHLLRRHETKESRIASHFAQQTGNGGK
jgi:hypothetical protein